MARKDDELDVWRLRYPSAGVSWNLIGDQVSCLKFTGYAKIMLYQLKNRMNLANPKLKSFMDKRSPVPGTTIIVKSIYGQDFIEISTGVGVGGGKEICSITFINFPLYVPPMRNPGKIKDGEVEGVDYFKTYYSIDISKCPACQKISWEFLFRYLQSSPLVPPTVPISTRKEWPIEPLHHQTFDADGKLIDEDVTDHTIYSLSSPAWGELISFGTDDGGNYIIWKAYTETPLLGEAYSRSGLAIMRLVARIRNEKGEEICAQNERIEVDCCRKVSDLREVEIWWEGIWECQPFIIYGDLHLCKAPTSLAMGGMSGLNWYACMHPYQPFYSLPDIRGVCLPVEWTLSGPIDFRGSGKNDNTIYIKCLETGCNEEATITLRDRCGGEYQIRARPCCEDAAELEINYTSLLMSCGQQQEFSASGGCGPYTWDLTGGGGEISSETGSSTVYTAPDTNPNCVSNPTIQVTDCCGNTATVDLAVNCYSDPGLALQMSEYTYAECPADNETVCHGNCYPDQVCIKTRRYQNSKYDCNGELYSYCDTGGDNYDCWDDCFSGGPAGCWSNQCGGHSGYAACGTLYDERSDAMKAAGCCPLNPLTGLPYD